MKIEDHLDWIAFATLTGIIGCDDWQMVINPVHDFGTELEA